MYLKDQIQMLIDRVTNSNEEVDNNEKAILRLKFINDQIQETKDELDIIDQRCKLLNSLH